MNRGAARHPDIQHSQRTPTVIEGDDHVPILRLPVTEIDCYDGDPRQFANDAYSAIRQGILDGEYWGVMLVTRRPDTLRYMLAAGSNTTLRILKELHAETNDPRFSLIDCREQPYRSESKLLTQHLAENLNRGEMKFWEIAVGIDKLLRKLEDERRLQQPDAGDFTVRDACAALAGAGLQADKSTVAIWRFAARRLHALGPALPALTARAVRAKLQTHILGLELLSKRFEMPQDTFDRAVLLPTLAEFGRTGAPADRTPNEGLDWEALCDKLDLATANQLAETAESVQSMMAALRLNPQATLQQLRMPSPSLIAQQRSQAKAPQEPPCPPGGQRPTFARETAAAPQSGSTAVPGNASTEPGRTDVTLTSARQDPTVPLDQSLDRIRAATEQLLAEVGLQGSLREATSMPLGFVIAPISGHADQVPSSLEADRQPALQLVRKIVWYSVSTITGQGMIPNEPGLETSNRTCQPTLADYLLARFDSAGQPIIRRLDDLMSSIFNFLCQQPERWSNFQRLVVPGANS